MKTIKINKTAERFQNEINQAIELAYGFLTSRYGWKFDNVQLWFTSTASRSRYYRNSDGENGGPVASIAIKTRTYLYDMKSLGIRYRNEGLPVGYIISTAMSIIHELTHHVQYENKLPTGELETTRNEVEFLMQYDQELFNLYLRK